MKKHHAAFLAGAVILAHSASGQSRSNTDSLPKDPVKTQKEALVNQQDAAARQHEAMAKQVELQKIQLEKSNEQKAVMDAVKKELINDQLIKKDVRFTLQINASEMMINGIKQPDNVHDKYIRLIDEHRKQRFGDKEEWKIQE